MGAVASVAVKEKRRKSGVLEGLLCEARDAERVLASPVIEPDDAVRAGIPGMADAVCNPPLRRAVDGISDKPLRHAQHRVAGVKIRAACLGELAGDNLCAVLEEKIFFHGVGPEGNGVHPVDVLSALCRGGPEVLLQHADIPRLLRCAEQNVGCHRGVERRDEIGRNEAVRPVPLDLFIGKERFPGSFHAGLQSVLFDGTAGGLAEKLSRFDQLIPHIGHGILRNVRRHVDAEGRHLVICGEPRKCEKIGVTGE